MATIGEYYLKSCSSAAFSQGVDIKSLMMKAGIAPRHHAKQSKRIIDSSMVLLLRSISEATNDAFLGFANQPITPQFFKLLMQSAALCPTIGEAINTLSSGFSLVDCELSMQRTNKQQIALTFSHQHKDPDNFLLEYLLVFIHRLLSWLAGKQLPLHCANVNYRPQHYQQEFTLLFRCPVAFEQSTNSLVFDNAIVDWPVMREPSAIHQVIAQFPLIVLRFPGAENATDRQVHQLLQREFLRTGQLFESSLAAKQLHISSATLRRQLAKLNTSFSQIKTELRHEQAIKLLSDSTLSIEIIASQLGYSEARAFSRVFKQWTDLTPTQYRQLL